MRDPLSEHHKRARYGWCLRHVGADFVDWGFSDEAKFEVADCSAAHRVLGHQSPSEKYAPCCVLRAPVQSRKKVIVWGCITRSGATAFCLLRENINADVYIRILTENILPLLDEMPLALRQKFVFQQDNAAPHRAHATQQFLRDNGVAVTDWPALSPDLNPIENVWAMLKREIRQRCPQTLGELEHTLTQVWHEVVTPRLFKNLFSSLPRRVELVL